VIAGDSANLGAYQSLDDFSYRLCYERKDFGRSYWATNSQRRHILGRAAKRHVFLARSMQSLTFSRQSLGGPFLPVGWPVSSGPLQQREFNVTTASGI